jgi:hypothetical protein
MEQPEGLTAVPGAHEQTRVSSEPADVKLALQAHEEADPEAVPAGAVELAGHRLQDPEAVLLK